MKRVVDIPCSKARFLDRAAAELALTRAKRNGRDEIAAYRCPREGCGYWHLTSQVQYEQRRQRRG